MKSSTASGVMGEGGKEESPVATAFGGQGGRGEGRKDIIQG